MVLESIWHDPRYAIRSYLKAPSFTSSSVTTLALGIGASTAIFSMVNGILLQPLPLPDPGPLVYANEVNGKGDRISVSWPNYLDWRARARSFEALANSREEAITLTGTDRAQRLRAPSRHGQFLSRHRVQPALGRGFTDDDDLSTARAGGDCQRRLLANPAWRRSQRARPDAEARRRGLHRCRRAAARFEFLRPYDLFLPMGRIAATPSTSGSRQPQRASTRSAG